jgi:hypothetical protein
MSNVGVKVQENEVFQHSDAIELFKRFFAGDDFPDDSDNTTAHKTLDRMTRSAVGRMFQIEQSLARSSPWLRQSIWLSALSLRGLAPRRPPWKSVLSPLSRLRTQRAKKLGMEIRSWAAVPARLQGEFNTQGELESFNRVEPHIVDKVA